METERTLRKKIHMRSDINTSTARKIRESVLNSSALVYLDTIPCEEPSQRYRLPRYVPLHNAVLDYLGTPGNREVELILIPGRALRPPRDTALFQQLETILTSDEQPLPIRSPSTNL